MDDICGVLWSKSAGNEPLSTGSKQLAEDGEAGVRRTSTGTEPVTCGDDVMMMA